MYPGGLPIRTDSFRVQTGEEPVSIEERIKQYYRVCIDDEGKLLAKPPLSEDEFEVLRQWLIYYLHAPIWQQMAVPGFQRLLKRSLAVSTWKQLHAVAFDALDYGLDPLS